MRRTYWAYQTYMNSGSYLCCVQISFATFSWSGHCKSRAELHPIPALKWLIIHGRSLCTSISMLIQVSHLDSKLSIESKCLWAPQRGTMWQPRHISLGLQGKTEEQKQERRQALQLRVNIRAHFINLSTFAMLLVCALGKSLHQLLSSVTFSLPCLLELHFICSFIYFLIQ